MQILNRERALKRYGENPLFLRLKPLSYQLYSSTFSLPECDAFISDEHLMARALSSESDIN